MATEVLTSSDEIQRQMQSIRSSLRADVKELVGNARDMTDWQYYVRRYPLASVATAAAVGFGLTALASPRAFGASQGVPLPSGENSLGLNSPLQSTSSEPSVVSRLLANLTGMASTALSRAALAFATQQLNKLVAENIFATPSSGPLENNSHAQSHH